MPLTLLQRFRNALDQWSGVLVPSSQDVSALGRRDPKALRAFLVRELAELSQELTAFGRDMGSGLRATGSKIRDLDDDALVEASPSLFHELVGARRLLQRLQIAASPTEELVEEWRGWEELRRLDPTDAEQPFKMERQELVRSELCVRGALPQHRSFRTDRAPVPEAAETIEAVVRQEEVQEEDVARFLDVLEEWDELRRSCGDQHLEAYGDVLMHLSHEASQGNRNAHQAFKDFRVLQAEQKAHDRVRGIRRDRLAVWGRE